MRITFTDKLVRNTVNEGSAFTVIAKFWDDSVEAWVAATPTTIRYRIDSLEGCYTILDWTSGSAATSLTITVSRTANAILDDCRARERKQLTVEVDAGLSTQYQGTYEWYTRNLTGQT